MTFTTELLLLEEVAVLEGIKMLIILEATVVDMKAKVVHLIAEKTNAHGCISSGGNQTSAGISALPVPGIGFSYVTAIYDEAKFWQGGGFIGTDESGWSSAGGGGGWYGGSRGCVYGSSGAGGSGFVFIKDSRTPKDYAIPSHYQMTNETILDGSEKIPSPLWNSSQTLDGNGAVRITFLDVPENLFDFSFTIPPKRIHRYPMISMLFILVSKSN